MSISRPWNLSIPALLMAGLLTACGGGGGGGGGGGDDRNAGVTSAPATTVPGTLMEEQGAPAFTGNTALDGFNWINYRRAQAGLPVLTRNSQIDTAAQGHSSYQKLNNTVTHEQTAGMPGFTGAQITDRLSTAGYVLTPPYAAGEVISAATDTSGFFLAEELITAIYHRFVIFEPVFKEIGTGSATAAGGYTYFTSDFAANNGYGQGLGRSHIVVYPIANQTKVATNFLTDQEAPDPVANQNETGYPISVHADISTILSVNTFTVRPHGSADLSVKLLSAATDKETSRSAAAIIPLAVLNANTTYDVSFSGTVDSVPVARTWSFTTR